MALFKRARTRTRSGHHAVILAHGPGPVIDTPHPQQYFVPGPIGGPINEPLTPIDPGTTLTPVTNVAGGPGDPIAGGRPGDPNSYGSGLGGSFPNANGPVVETNFPFNANDPNNPNPIENPTPLDPGVTLQPAGSSLTPVLIIGGFVLVAFFLL